MVILNRILHIENARKMASFPLYSTISGQVGSSPSPLSETTKTQLCLDIRSFDVEAQERVYGLIKSHDTCASEAPSVVGLPFSGSSLKTGIKFDLDSLPVRLQSILFAFACLHQEQSKPKPEE